MFVTEYFRENMTSLGYGQVDINFWVEETIAFLCTNVVGDTFGRT